MHRYNKIQFESELFESELFMTEIDKTLPEEVRLIRVPKLTKHRTRLLPHMSVYGSNE